MNLFFMLELLKKIINYFSTGGRVLNFVSTSLNLSTVEKPSFKNN
jgi:hypothetical protein